MTAEDRARLERLRMQAIRAVGEDFMGAHHAYLTKLESAAPALIADSKRLEEIRLRHVELGYAFRFIKRLGMDHTERWDAENALRDVLTLLGFAPEED